MGMVTAASLVLADPDTVAVRRLGIDEHRYRSVPSPTGRGVGLSRG